MINFEPVEGVGNTYKKYAGMKKNVANTSLDAYHNEITPNIGPKQAKVYEAIKTMVQATDAELSFFLHMDTRSVGPRRYELVKMGKVILAETRECSVTHRTAKAWRIAD